MDGMFPSEDCKGYYQCIYTNTPHAKQILQACPTGLMFDNNLKTCNYQSLVKC